jgi:A/G-specific adenine glycosylase
LVRRLLRWFSQDARDLPWRRTLDPYAIWISEIMLQQTQVKTVIPYWTRWMRALPNVRALARATPERVLKLWEGLGYYTRARNLHRAARLLVGEHRATFPRQFQDVLNLPGVGRYTAGAICSIAFNQAVPVLDGNVIRVLARVFEIHAEPRSAATQVRLWRLAEALVVQAAAEPADYRSPRAGRCAGNCSLLNQALMELGAVICTPRQPKCTVCPLRQRCQAFRSGCAAQLPRAPGHRSAVTRRMAAFVAEQRGRYLVRQRPAGAINGRLWEFPNMDVVGERFDALEAARCCLGDQPADLSPLCTIRHAITSSRITLHAFRARLPHRRISSVPGARWLALSELRRLAFTGAHRKILARIVAELVPGWSGQPPTLGTRKPRAGISRRGAVKVNGGRKPQPKNTLATS